MIVIRGLHKEFTGGVKALKNIAFTVSRGEFNVILGPSGAGKSTLLRCINGLVKPTSGEVLLDGIPVSGSRRLEQVRKKVGMIFQQFNLVKRLTVLENVMCGRLAHSNVFTSCLKLFPPSEIEFAMECLRRVGLADKAYHRADQLSGGQQQRVGIARALAQCPDVILADEPVASLDPRSAEMVMDILRNINDRDGITVLVSLHNVDLAKCYAGRAVGIREGCLVLDKPMGKVTQCDVDLLYGYTGDNSRKEFASVRQAMCVNA